MLKRGISIAFLLIFIAFLTIKLLPSLQWRLQNIASTIQGRESAADYKTEDAVETPIYREELVRIYKTETPKLKTMFEGEGSEKTVAYFEENYKDYDHDTIHVLEHFLGKELYLRKGINGVSLCPLSLVYGCFHAFFAEAFSREGRKFLSRAESVCKFTSNFLNAKDFLKASSCLHGLGHGFLSLEGNSNIVAALKDCDSISYQIPFGIEMCYTGVFMDYNESRRIINQEDIGSQINEPCTKVPKSYQPACYLQLAQWWGEITKDNFELMGQLCTKVKDEKNKESCFRSIGMVITRETKADNFRIWELCNKMPKSGIVFCLEESAKLLSILGKPDTSSPCAYLDSSAKNECEANVKNFMCNSLLICR